MPVTNHGGGRPTGLPFSQVWCVDFEFHAPPGERPRPICLVAQELFSGKVIKQWHDEMGARPPYPTDASSLFCAYYASADLGCHLTLGWPMPERILDPFVEFRWLTNGMAPPSGYSMLGAMAYFGLDTMAVAEKTMMREIAIRGWPFTSDERAALLHYNADDAAGLANLVSALVPRIDLPRALLRGRYMAAAAHMEWAGVPVDMELVGLLRERWERIQGGLIDRIDSDFMVYEDGHFRAHLFEKWLERAGVPWPRLVTGRLDLTDDTFREMAKSQPSVAPLRELRSSLSELRLNTLAVGHDGRNRTILSAFRARTSRNQPSNAKFIFGPATWLRGLIKPPPGYGVAYVDWSQQEFGIAAALSGDTKMQDAYRSGDPYLAFAAQAGAVPQDATKQSHGAEREQFKACVLAVGYGMGHEALADRIGQPTIKARSLLQLHHETYRRFWRWSDGAVDHAMSKGHLYTVFGWRVLTVADANPRSMRNFPAQGNGAEMLRLACCLATERGVEVCAPVHDAVLIASPLDSLREAVVAMREAMREASAIVLNGFELGTDVKVVRYPDRYMDPRGERMWRTVMGLVRDPHYYLSKEIRREEIGHASDYPEWPIGKVRIISDGGNDG